MIAGYVLDANNVPVGDEEVDLLDSTGNTVIATRLTDANGYYQFTGLSNLAYYVQQIVPAGYTAASPTLVSVTIQNCSSARVDFTIVANTGGDTCGYTYSSAEPRTSIVFNESEVLRDFSPKGGFPAAPGTRLKLWYNDEHTLTLGVRQVAIKTAGGTTTTNYPVSPLNAVPDSVTNPEVGATGVGGSDPYGRPMYPSLFITDLTSNPNNRAGDWQFGGTPIAPSIVYGAWKAAIALVDQTKSPALISITPDTDSAKTNWTLGAGSDTPPGGLINQGFGAEIVWNVDDLLASGAILPGHTYRLQMIVHDGDQNKTGGDVGEACTTVFSSAPTATPTNVPTSTPTNTPANTPTNTPTITPVPVGNLCVLEWNDLNGNQTREVEPLLNGAAMSVYAQPSGTLIGSWVTNGSEPHCFNSLAPGQYLVTDATPSGYTPTTPVIYNVQVLANQTIEVDFGAWVLPTATPTPTRVNAPTDTPTSTPTNTPLPTNTPTPVPGCIAGTKQNSFGQFLPNWVVIASWTDASGQHSLSATTDGTGKFQFDNLTPGIVYTVAEIPQAGWTAIIPSSWTVMVNSGTTCSTVVYVNQAPPTATPTPTRVNAPTDTPTPTNTPTPVPGCIAGTKQNIQGQFLPNWLVTASWTDPVLGPQARTATTDVNGRFQIDNLTPGIVYTVAEVMQSGWTAIIPSSWTVMVNPGTTCSTVVYVNQPPAVSPTPTNTPISPVAICGNVYNDANANGAIDTGETKVTGVFVTLLDSLNNPLTAIPTDGSGHYCFNNLTAGTYSVNEAIPAGFVATNAIPSVGGSKISSVKISVTATTPGTTYQPNDFLIAQPTPTPTPTRVNAPTDTPTSTPTNTPVLLGQVCALVYNDQNVSGARNPGEPLLVNALITIQDPIGTVVGTRVTNGTEPYCVGNLPPGNYTVIETDPTGYTSTTPNQIVSVVNPGSTVSIEFGDVALPTPTPTTAPVLGRLCSLVWFDQNANTVRDSEPLLSGAVITMKDPSGTVIGTRLTNGTEPFCVDNLPAGNYTVTEINPSGGYLSTTPDTATVTITNGTTQTVQFGDTLPPTPTNTPVFVPTNTPTNTPVLLGQICALVYNDLNANGARNGEPLLTNALITVKDPSGTVVGTRLTNGTEPYCVGNLQPGNYTVTETDPAGYTSTTPNQIVSVLNPGSIVSIEFGDVALPTPTPIPTNTPIPPGQVCMLVYFDQNANAARNTGEPLLSNALLTIKDANGTIVGTRTTNGTEPFCLVGLPPGNYTVTQTPPNGYTPTTPTQIVATVPPGGSVSVEFGDNALATPTPSRTPTPAPPIPIPVNEPKSMVSDPLRNHLYVASHLDGRVLIWDEIAQRALTTIPVGIKPVGVGLVNDRVFIGVNGNLWVSVIDAATMTKMPDIKLNDQRAAMQCDGAPMNLAVHPGLKRVYVALHGSGRVAVIDAVNNTLIDCIPANSGTMGVAVDPGRNRLYVTNRDGMDLQVFDISVLPARMVQDIHLNGVPYFVATDPATGKVFAAVALNPPDFDNVNNLYVYSSDGNTLSLVTVSIIGNTHDGGHLWVSQADGMLYIAATTDSQLQIYNPNTLSLGTTMAMPVPYGITENRGLGRMYIANRDINSISVVSDNLR